MYRHFLHYTPVYLNPDDCILQRAYHQVLLLKVQQFIPEAKLIEELSTYTSICIQTADEVIIDEEQLRPLFAEMKWNKKLPAWLKGE